MSRRAARSQADLTLFPESLQAAANDIIQHNKEVYDMWVIDAAKAKTMDRGMLLRRHFHAEAAAYSQKHCRALSAQILKRLPRELRDAIYGYLCEGIRRISISIADAQGEVRPQYIYRVQTSNVHFAAPRHLREYMGSQFMTELGPVLYRKARFHVSDAADVEDFLTQDIFRVGLSPKDHVRKLSLVLFTDRRHTMCDINCTREIKTFDHEPSKEEIETKLQSLGQLINIKHREGFHLDLHLCLSVMYKLPSVARFQQILLPYLYDLKAAGFTIRLPLRTYYYGDESRSTRSEMNQLQASSSTDPADWEVDDEELDAWTQSPYILPAREESFWDMVSDEGWETSDDDG